MTKKMKIMIAAGVGSVLAIFIIYALISMMAGESTLIKYQVTSKDGVIEVRQYPAVLVAQIEMQGDQMKSLEEGVGILREFFDGKNNFYKKMDSYAPIMMQEDASTPLKWDISIIMPQKYKNEEIPVPDDKRVRFVEIPAQSFAALSFSGGHSKSNLEENLDALNRQLQKNQIIPKSKPVFLFYSPGWTLPMMRTIEVMTFVPADLELRQDLD